MFTRIITTISILLFQNLVFAKSIKNHKKFLTKSKIEKLQIKYHELGVIESPEVSGTKLQATSVETIGPLVAISYNVAGPVVKGGIDLVWHYRGKYKKYASYVAEGEEYADLKFVFPNIIIASGQKEHIGALVSIFKFNRQGIKKVSEIELPGFYATSIQAHPLRKVAIVNSGNNAGVFKINFKNPEKPKIVKDYPVNDSIYHHHMHRNHLVLTSNDVTALEVYDKKSKELESKVYLCEQFVEAPARFSKVSGDVYTNACNGYLFMIDYNRKTDQYDIVGKAETKGKGNGIDSIRLFGHRYSLHALAQGDAGLHNYVSIRKKQSIHHVGGIDSDDSGSANNVQFKWHLFNRPYIFVADGKLGVRIIKLSAQIK